MTEAILLIALVVTGTGFLWTLLLLGRDRRRFFLDAIEHAIRVEPQEPFELERLRKRHRLSATTSKRLCERLYDGFFWDLARSGGISGANERRLENAAILLRLDRGFLARYTGTEMVRAVRASRQSGRATAVTATETASDQAPNDDDTRTHHPSELLAKGSITAQQKDRLDHQKRDVRPAPRHESSRVADIAARHGRAIFDSPETLVGAHIGSCRIEELLGKGASGVVYRATMSPWNKPVTVKILGLARPGAPEAAQRTLREARACARLKSPHIVPVLHVGEEGELQYLVFDYVEGESLSKAAKRQERFEPRRALEIMRSVFEALAVAHAQGFVHRDIKPGNILLARDGRVLVTDFGLALDPEDPQTLTHSDHVVGTPTFMAPELCRGEPAGPQSDLYAAGITLSRLLTGEYPFRGSSAMAVMYEHLHGEALAPSSKDAALAPCDALCATLLVKDPRVRCADAHTALSLIAQALLAAQHQEESTRV